MRAYENETHGKEKSQINQILHEFGLLEPEEQRINPQYIPFRNQKKHNV